MSLPILLRIRLLNRKVNVPLLHKNTIRNCSSKDGDDLNKKEDDGKTKAATKLNELLKRMVEEDVDKSKSKLNLAKPKNRKDKLKEEPGIQSVETEPVEKKIVEAVQNVAQAIGGDVKETESQLLSKLLNPVKNDTNSISTSISEIVKGMKIDRETKVSEQMSRAHLVKLIQNSRGGQIKRQGKSFKKNVIINRQDVRKIEKIDLFGSEPLGIFSSSDVQPENVNINRTWQRLHQKELQLAITHPPANYFQQMILWTEQGKLWKFPIDNEQGMEEEQNVYFAEHVFLEKHLESWCPTKGPIRHFMELVCVGLSKNPYMSVQHKKEHIEWFQNYFNDKKQLLKEIGALPVDEAGETKQITN